MISIIIPVYNGAKFLEKFSLPSLERQSFSDWEALLINDGSSDNSAAIIARWVARDKRFKYFAHETNRGLAAALNTGLKNAQGEIIAWLEQDDLWLRDKLKIQISKLGFNNLMTACRYFSLNIHRQKIDGLGSGNFSTLMARREIVTKLFPLPEDKKYLGIEDGLLAARLALLVEAEKINPEKLSNNSEPLVIFSHEHASLSGHRNPRLSQARYQAALDLFKTNTSPSLNKLKQFWQQHARQNRYLAFLPDFIQKKLRYLNERLKQFKLRREFQESKKSPYYLEALQIIKQLKD